MAEIQLEKSKIHPDVLRVKSPPTKNAKQRSNVATNLRAKAKREDNGVTVATRGEDVYVVTSEAGKKALPKISGRGQPGTSLSELIAAAK